MPIATPEPGLYEGVPAETYHRWDCVSYSTLKRVREQSPMHARHWLDHPPPQTKAMGLGEALHTAVLEPDTFEERVVEGLGVTRVSKANKEAWAAFEADHPGKIILKPAEWRQCTGMRDAVLAHKGAEEILTSPGYTEVSLVWDDEETGVRCRMRADGLRQWRGYNLIFDLKTEGNYGASMDGAKRAIGNFLYDMQASMYSDGAEALDPLSDFRFAFMFVETTAPFGVQCFEPSPSMIYEGRHKWRRALRQWTKCVETGVFTGYSSQLESISLPKFAEVAERETQEDADGEF